jgi:hypothetical protein
VQQERVLIAMRVAADVLNATGLGAQNEVVEIAVDRTTTHSNFQPANEPIVGLHQ